jgi:membrane-associated phospholipid phosphatase
LKKILPLFSYLFHPIFIPLFGSLLYFYLESPFYELQQIAIILLQIVIVTLFIPICFFYLLRTLGAVDSVMISQIAQRKIPLFVQIILIVILIQKAITIDRTPELYFFFLGGLTSSIVAFLLLFVKIKASMHLIGMSTLTAFLIGLSLHFQTNNLYLISFFLFMNGVVASSRLVMKAHTPREILIGFAIGLLPQIAFFWLWL